MTIESIYPALGTAIRALRRARGLSQQDLVEVLGYARVSSVCDLEHGRIRLHVHQLLLLAELFEVPVVALLFGADAEMAGKSKDAAVKDLEWREY